jgi:hypothetical protein
MKIAHIIIEFDDWAIRTRGHLVIAKISRRAGDAKEGKVEGCQWRPRF